MWPLRGLAGALDREQATTCFMATNIGLPPSAHDRQHEASPWATLRQVLTGGFPPEAPRPQSFSLVVKVVATPILIVRGLSPSTWFRNRGANAIDAMVMVYSATTALTLAFVGPHQSSIPWLAL